MNRIPGARATRSPLAIFSGAFGAVEFAKSNSYRFEAGFLKLSEVERGVYLGDAVDRL
ncbi:MAG: hypothetical protein IPL01_20730 [Acidobacteria bacterium]|nr:hypothetical protein [Acidobacteriota bacterium]MBK9708162.1 hypothetical protein [Acidobacteriota bacterium]